MEDLYRLHSMTDYSDQSSPAPPQPPMENLVFPVNCQNYSSSVNSADHFNRIPSFGSDPLMAAEIQKTRSAHDKEESSRVIRAQITSHPLYPKLLQAFIDCQKVGAPPEIVDVIDEIHRGCDISRRAADVSTFLGADPELDEFMELYCGILVKYKSDLSTPFVEATSFLNNMEMQLNSLCNGGDRSHFSDEGDDSSEEDPSAGEVELHHSRQADGDRELKDKLLRKYSGYISNLKHEFSKTKKKGKLPKDARQILLDWWNIHYKWPYPTETDKIQLAESTGLDPKQINNWFINQRKRHWKPSENMQFSVMNTLYGPLSDG